MILENWSVTTLNPYEAPEIAKAYLCGDVYGHHNPKHEDGKRIVTTRIIGLEGATVLTKSGSKYELGAVDPEYENIFPNARERLFSSLKDLK